MSSPGPSGATPTSASPTVPAPHFVAASSATALADELGVNLHSAYPGVWTTSQLATYVERLGITQVRDNLAPSNAHQAAVWLDLACHGVRVDALLGVPTHPAAIQPDLDAMVARNSASRAKGCGPEVTAIEGSNEWNLQSGQASAPCASATWAQQDRSFSTTLWRDVQATPALRGVRVIAPSVGNEPKYPGASPCLGNLASVTTDGNVHNYPSDQMPGYHVVSQMDAESKYVSGNQPIDMTESGYTNNAVGNPGDLPVSQAAAAIYLPELAVLAASHPGGATVVHTDVYDLVDVTSAPGDTNYQDHFGLYGYSPATGAITPKPAALAIQRFQSLVGPASSPRSLGGVTYSLSAPAGTTLHTLLVENASGRYQLLIWRDAPVWCASVYVNHVPGCTAKTVNRDLSPVPVTATLHLARGWDARVDAPSRAAERLYTSPQRVTNVTLHLTGDLQVVTLTNPG